MAEKAKVRPSRSFYFNGVTVSVFSRTIAPKEKDKKPFTVHSISVQQSYVDEKGVRQYTTNLDGRNLPTAIALMQEAFGAINGERDNGADEAPTA